MVSEQLNHDIFRMRGDMTPHRIGCRVYGPDGRPLMAGQKEPFDNITEVLLHSETEEGGAPLLIRSRRMLDVSEVYDVWDAGQERRRLGSIRRMRHRSLLKDEWAIIPEGANARSAHTAVLRRALCGIHDHRYHIYVDGGYSGVISEKHAHRGPIWIEADFTPDIFGLIDRRLGLAAGVLLVVMEAGG